MYLDTMTTMTKAVVLSLLVTTFSAKPMNPSIGYLAEFAPEISSASGSLAFNKDKTDNMFYMPPVLEQVKYTSNSMEMDVVEEFKKEAEKIFTEIEKKNRRDVTCNLI